MLWLRHLSLFICTCSLLSLPPSWCAQVRYLYLDPFPACSPVERVTPLKTLLWHPRLASFAIPKPYFPHCDIVCLFVCLSYMCLSNILMERTEDPILSITPGSQTILPQCCNDTLKERQVHQWRALTHRTARYDKQHEKTVLVWNLKYCSVPVHSPQIL